MPYRRRGRVVEVQKGGTWQTVPGGRHESEAKAEAHLRALNIHVEHRGGERTMKPKKKGGY